MDVSSFLVGLVVGMLIYYLLKSRTNVSNYDILPFEGMADAAAVKASLKTQVTAIVTEMSTALKTAKTENKTIDERIVIANKSNDQLCQVNKAFTEWSLRHDSG
jgi:hypothetical protein